jgi:tripartite-type tricarboxylate transporter receptor subunit TctC
MPRMRRRPFLLLASLVVPTRAMPQPQGASGFPTKPITLIVPFGPGGIADLTARAVGEAITRSLGQTVIVDNKPGAGGIVASQAVANAPPDGHTLLLMSNATAVSASLYRKLPYDAVKSFAPVSMIGSFDLGIFVGASSRFTSLQDLIVAAKAAPGKLTLGTITAGSTQHLAAEFFKSRSATSMVHVPYKGTPAVLTALRSGEIDLAFEILGPVLPQLSGGGLRCLAVTGPQRAEGLPQVPTVQESGVAGYDVASWNAIAAPAGTPAAVIERLNAVVREALETAALRDKLSKLRMRVRATTPAQLDSHLQAEIKRWAEVVRTAKIEPE